MGHRKSHGATDDAGYGLILDLYRNAIHNIITNKCNYNKLVLLPYSLQSVQCLLFKIFIEVFFSQRIKYFQFTKKHDLTVKLTPVNVTLL